MIKLFNHLILDSRQKSQPTTIQEVIEIITEIATNTIEIIIEIIIINNKYIFI